MSYTLAYTGAEIDALLGKIDAIFVAEYGSTIYSEVTAAIAAGNKVIVANAGKVYVYAGQDDNGGYVFTQAGPNAQSPSVTYATLSTGDVWSTATGALPSITYVDNAVATEQARAEGVEAGKADSDGIYPDLTAGTALQLLGNTYTEDKTPYNFRKSGGSVKVGTREKDKIVGGTIAWNQQFNIANPPKGPRVTNYQYSGGSFSWHDTGNSNNFIGSEQIAISNHKLYVTINNTSAYALRLDKYNPYASLSGIIQANTEYATITDNGTSQNFIVFSPAEWTEDRTLTAKNFVVIDLTQMFGSTIADYIYSLEQANAGDGVAWFRNLFPKPYYDYNAGELMSVKASAHNMTGKNLVAGSVVYETGSTSYWKLSETTYLKAGSYTASIYNDSANAARLFVNTIVNGVSTTIRNISIAANSRGTTAFTLAEDTVVNLDGRFDPTANIPDITVFNRPQIEFGSTATPYEPHELHSYALDPDLELRGMPKLDANNALYYDGDIYEADGNVERRYGIVDLGSLDWIHDSAHYRFRPGSGLSDIKSVSANDVANIIAEGYVTVDNTTYWEGNVDKTVSVNGVTLWCVYHAAADAAAFKAAMSGVYLVYELATPTSESADPYAEIQIVSPYGTEEYVDERAVAIPVGHDTEYPTDLVAKIEEIPDPPTADGTYTLKASVSGGSVTYSWEA